MDPLNKIWFLRDGAEPNYHSATREFEKINPADEAKIKLPKKREAEQKKELPEGAKGPKFTKKQISRETNARAATQFGNLTDYWRKVKLHVQILLSYCPYLLFLY